MRIVDAQNDRVPELSERGGQHALRRDGELDPKKREVILQRIQQLMHDKVMYLPIWQLSVLNGYGPRGVGTRAHRRLSVGGAVRGLKAK